MGTPSRDTSPAPPRNLDPTSPLRPKTDTMAVTSQPRQWKHEKFACMEDKNLCITCWTPNWLNVLRTKYRTQQNIEGDVCHDCIDVSCWGPCVLCQLKRDIDASKEDGSLNNIAVMKRE